MDRPRTAAVRARAIALTSALLLLAAALPGATPALGATATALRFNPGPPASVDAGVSFEVKVEAVSGSTVDTAWENSVYFSSSDPKAVISPASSAALVDGAGSFTITLKTPGTQTVVFSATSLTPASRSLTVNLGAPSRMIWNRQPSSGANDAVLANQPTVSIQDLGGNPITSDNATYVSLTLLQPAGGTGTGTLGGCTSPVKVVNGVASFAGCRVAGIGKNFTLLASDATPARTNPLSSSISGAFDISSSIGFEVQPGGGKAVGGKAQAGVAFGTQPKVSVRWPTNPTNYTSDKSTNDSVTAVTLSLKPNTGTAGAVLTCDALTKTAVAGSASFSGCKIDKDGTGYVIVATPNPYYSGSVESAPFDVGGGNAPKLIFVTAPKAGMVGVALSPAPVVGVADVNGNLVSSSPAVTIKIDVKSDDDGDIKCTENEVASAVGGNNGGKASFADCKIDTAGTYQLVASANGYLSALSDEILVAAANATLKLEANYGAIVYGRAVTLTATFGSPGVKTFAIESSIDNKKTWQEIEGAGEIDTDEDGVAQVDLQLARTMWLRANFDGSGGALAAVSAPVQVAVRQAIAFTPKAKITKIKQYKSVKMTAKVSPYDAATPLKVTFDIYQRMPEGDWRRIAGVRVETNDSGVAVLNRVFLRAGRFYVRASVKGTKVTMPSNLTPIRYIIVSPVGKQKK